MKINLLKNSNFQLFFTLILFVYSNVSAQLLKEYSGPLKIQNLEGTANYTYITKNTDTLFEGVFQVKKEIDLNSSEKKPNDFFSITGAFKDNLPHKNWQFTFGKFRPGEKMDIVDSKYVIGLNGLRQKIKGSFFEGKLQGKWIIESDSIQNSNTAKTLFTSSIEFDNGIPQKSFRIDTEENHLVGRFLRDGYAHDAWTLYTNEEIEDIENWRFDKGRLIEINFTNINGVKETLNVFKDFNQKTKTIRLDENFIKILNIYLPYVLENRSGESNIIDLLEENVNFYSKIESIYSSLGSPVKFEGAKVEVPFYPVSEENVNLLKEIALEYRSANGISNQILDNTQLNLLKLSDDDMKGLYAIVLKLRENYIERFDDIVKLYEKDLLQYLDNDRIINLMWPDGIKTMKVDPKFGENHTFFTAGINNLDIAKDPFLTLKEIIKNSSQLLFQINTILETKISGVQKQKEIVSEEEKLIVKEQQLEKRIDSLSNVLSSEEISAIFSLGTYMQKKLNVYAELPNDDLKLKSARALNDCFENINVLISLIENLSAQNQVIQQQYTEPMWNPFTFTIMDEIVKKRIVDAYQKVVIPGILDQIKNDPGCDRFKDQSKLIKRVQERILELRTADTSKMERKLKREKDPEAVLELLGIEMSM